MEGGGIKAEAGDFHQIENKFLKLFQKLPATGHVPNSPEFHTAFVSADAVYNAKPII